VDEQPDLARLQVKASNLLVGAGVMVLLAAIYAVGVYLPLRPVFEEAMKTRLLVCAILDASDSPAISDAIALYCPPPFGEGDLP